MVLLNVTATFANSFDMDKYVANFTASDFIVADAGQFQTGGDSFNGEMALPQALVDEIDAQGGVTEGGKVYGKTSPVEEFVTEEYYRTSKSWWYDAEQLDSMIRFKDRNEAGLLADTAQIYGMEPFALDPLRGTCPSSMSRAATMWPPCTATTTTERRRWTATGPSWGAQSPCAMWRSMSTMIPTPARSIRRTRT